MLVKMLVDREDSLNDGRTSQVFLGGQLYDVPDAIGAAWIKEQWATSAGGRGSKDVRRATFEVPPTSNLEPGTSNPSSNPEPRTKR